MSEINVKAVRDNSLDALKINLDNFRALYGYSPHLAIILAGNDPASESYVRTKRKMCSEVGIETSELFFDSDVTENTLLSVVDRLNTDAKVNGILVQLPLPSGVDSAKIIERLNPVKDVDGLTSFNMGLLMKDEPRIIPCTPKGILRILDYYKISTEGRRVAIINRSQIVGRPLAAALISSKRNATVVSCNSKTVNLREIVADSDIIVAASGNPEFIDSSWKFKKGAVLIDVSICRVPDKSQPKGYRVCGDFKKGDADKLRIGWTPVPGGVGLMTVMMLLENTLELAEIQGKSSSYPR